MCSVCAAQDVCVHEDALLWFHSWHVTGSRDSMSVGVPDQKVASSNPSTSSWRIFFSRVIFLCWLLFSVCSNPMLLQWYVKDPGHSAKSAGGRLHLNMHTPLTQQSWSGLTMPLSRHSVGTYLETCWHTTCHGTFSHSCLGSLSHCGLVLA